MGASLNYFYVCAHQDELLIFLMNYFILKVQATDMVLSDYDYQFSFMVKKSPKAENGVELLVSIYQDQDDENTLVVDFKKKSGSTPDYYFWVRNLREKILLMLQLEKSE